MGREENIPEFALQPAKEPEEIKSAGGVFGDEMNSMDMATVGGSGIFPETPCEHMTNSESDFPQLKTAADNNMTEHLKEAKEVPGPKGLKEPREAKDVKEPRDSKDLKESKDAKEPVTIKPITNRIDYSQLKITGVKEDMSRRVTVEEDILVPDTQPDLLSVLMLDGSVKLDSSEIKPDSEGPRSLSLGGMVRIHTVYLPVYGRNVAPVITVDTPLPFDFDWNISVSVMSHLSAMASIEKIEYTIINERKLRVKASIRVDLKEYSGKELDLFEEIRGEEVQLLKEEIKLTDVTARKRDIIDLNERLMIPMSDSVPETVLKYDISVCEGHKQITREKAVINGLINCTVMYLEKQGEYEEEVLRPRYYQGKAEFTQFIPLETMENVVGSKVSFDCSDVDISIKKVDDDPGQYYFALGGTVTTSLEVYTDIKKEIVADIYHNDKDIDYDTAREEIRILAGMGSTEFSIRDVMNITELMGSVEEIIYLNGHIRACTTTVQQNKCIVEGTVSAKLLCLGKDEGSKPFSVEENIPFRGTVDVMGAAEGMEGNTKVDIKELWFDKINGTQIEISGNIFAVTEVVEKRELRLIKNLCYVEKEGSIQKKPSMVLYITREGDDLWKIAKRYRTTVGNLREINHIDGDEGLAAGRKLLVVR